MNVKPLTEDELRSLSPEIRDLVVALRDADFNTVDSGDGSNLAQGMSCALPFKMVAIQVEREELCDEADRLAEWFASGNPGWEAYQIQASYTPGSAAIIILAEVGGEALDEIEEAIGHRPSGLIQ